MEEILIRINEPMLLKFNKIPRGIIYHSIYESLCYLFGAMFRPLEEQGKVHAFENAFASYCKRNHCIAFPYARTAIWSILKQLDLPQGSAIIMPPITIKGILDAVMDLGLKPVYVELDPDTACFEESGLLEVCLKPEVRAAIVTPLFGLVPDLKSMCDLLRSHSIFIIEDFSQCLNGQFSKKRVGTFGDAAVYSSSSIKTLDTLGGGLALTDSDELASALRDVQEGLAPPNRFFLIRKAWINFVRNLATSRGFFSLVTFPFLRSLAYFRPEAALKQTGHRKKEPINTLPAVWFTRYTSLQAKIGLEQLEHVSACDTQRVAYAERIRSSVTTRIFPRTTPHSENVYWQLIMLVPDAQRAQSWFARCGIDVATSSLALLSTLSAYPNASHLPSAERLYFNGIFVPCFPGLTEQDLDRLIEAIRGAPALNAFEVKDE